MMNILFTLLLNINLINSAIYLSQAVYCNTTLWNCKTCDKNYKLKKTIEKYGEKIIFGNNEERTFIAFRGSSNIENWIDDIQISHSCYKNNICIEKGFDKTIVHKVVNLLKKAEFKRYQAPPLLKVSNQAFGSGWKKPIASG